MLWSCGRSNIDVTSERRGTVAPRHRDTATPQHRNTAASQHQDEPLVSEPSAEKLDPLLQLRHARLRHRGPTTDAPQFGVD